MLVTIYRPKSVSEEPECAITHWSIRELPNQGRHLVGVIPENMHHGRVTSKIMEYQDRTITTRSGRRYHLTGEPGGHQNGEYVWQAWCLSNRIDPSDAVDVTEEYAVTIN